jgi:hypothetical protein
MREELENKLMTDYRFYGGYLDKGLPFECGDGWYPMLVELSDKIKAILDLKKHHTFNVVQVKEKFGTLRFYADGCTEAINDLIDEYEKKSKAICELCGEKSSLITVGHWIYNRCPDCAQKLTTGYNTVQV